MKSQAANLSDRRESLKMAGTGMAPAGLFVPGTGHVDLYDRVTLIPFDKLTSFINKHLVAASAR